MRFILSNQEFIDAMDTCMKISSKKDINPLHEMTGIFVYDGKIVFFAANQISHCVYTTKCEQTDRQAICFLPTQKLYNVSRNLDFGNGVTFDFGNIESQIKLTIKSGKSKMHIAGLFSKDIGQEDEFIYDMVGEQHKFLHTLRYAKDELSFYLQNAMFAIGNNTYQTAYNSLCINKTDTTDYVGTDGFYMSCIISESTDDNEFQVIIPLDVIDMVHSKKDACTISISETRILFDYGETKIYGVLSKGGYPPYETLLVYQKVLHCELKVKDLLSAMKRISIFFPAGNSDVDISMSLAVEQLHLTYGDDNNQIIEIIDGTFEGEMPMGNRILCSGQRLMSILNTANKHNDDIIMDIGKITDTRFASIFHISNKENKEFIIYLNHRI